MPSLVLFARLGSVEVVERLAETREDPTLSLERGVLKSLMRLLLEVLRDRGTWCNASTTLDFKTVERRVEHEGLSFLTITLPTFGSDLQKGLDLGYVDRSLFTGFQWKGGLPRFLGGFLGLVFDRNTGRLLDAPSADAIQAVRQITLMFAKMDLPCSSRRTEAALDKYVKCEMDVRAWDDTIRTRPALLEEFRHVSTTLWRDPLQRVDESVYAGDLTPRHGPGATADKLSGNRKFEQGEWTRRLEYLFPYGEFLAPSWRYFQDLPDVTIHEPETERPVRVITVPKTLKTPRIIAIEPTCMQYTQQALLERLVNELGRNNHPASWLIGFTDQEVNNLMAQDGSLTGDLATLDLSEASDRVSNQLVRELAAPYPHLHEALDATRSRKADVPGHGVLRLSKYASMGSALCFPVEAMVFATIVFVGISRALRRRLTLRDYMSFQGQVRVYGDDIIVPVDYVSDVITALEDFGLLVNRDKSFWSGNFRESCGKEYYGGTDVSITRVRRMFPSSHRDVPELVSLVSLRNQFYFAGYWGVTRWLDSEIGSKIPFPQVLPTSAVLGRHSLLGYETQKMCPHLQTPLVRGHVVKSVLPKSHLEGYGALLKYFLKRGDLPHSEGHLEHYGRPKSVRTKLRWTQPF